MFRNGEVEQKSKYDQDVKPPAQSFYSRERSRTPSTPQSRTQPTRNWQSSGGWIMHRIAALQDDISAVHGENGQYEQEFESQDDQGISTWPAFHFAVLKSSYLQDDPPYYKCYGSE